MTMSSGQSRRCLGLIEVQPDSAQQRRLRRIDGDDGPIAVETSIVEMAAVPEVSNVRAMIGLKHPGVDGHGEVRLPAPRSSGLRSGPRFGCQRRLNNCPFRIDAHDVENSAGIEGHYRTLDPRLKRFPLH